MHVLARAARARARLAQERGTVAARGGGADRLFGSHKNYSKERFLHYLSHVTQDYFKAHGRGMLSYTQCHCIALEHALCTIVRDVHMRTRTYITLHCIALHCIATHCSAAPCTALDCAALHCTALHCPELHYIHVLVHAKMWFGKRTMQWHCFALAAH